MFYPKIYRHILLCLFFVVCFTKLFSQEFAKAKDKWDMPVFFPPETGVRGGFNPVNDSDVFNPHLFYSQSKKMGEGFKSIKGRRKFYKQVNDSVQQICKWFRAACIVTKGNSLGAAEKFNFWILNKRACSFMKQGNAYLFIFNRNVAEQLIDSGKINRIFVTAWFKDSTRQEVFIYEKQGRELDKALVLFEQTLVQYYINLYQQQYPTLKMDKAFHSINRAMRLPFAPKAVKRTIKNNFSKSQPFRFQSFDDRVKLGYGLIDYLYKK